MALRAARSDRHRRGDAGSAIAEFAMTLPILALFALGVLEFGFAWNEGNLAERATSDAARTGSATGRALEADQDIVLSIGSSFAAARSIEVERVIVFRAATADGEVPSDCLSVDPAPGGAGVDDVCNVYSGAQVESGAGFRWSTDDCLSSSWDHFWCPADRVSSRRESPHHVGVFVEARYHPLTGIFGGEQTFERKAVYLIEPDSVAGGS